MRPLVEARDVTITFPGRTSRLIGRAPRIVGVDSVSVAVERGTSLAIVGESGSGKTTLVRALLGLTPLDSGKVTFDGRPVLARGRERWLRSRTGIVFQDPYSSLNPRMTIGQIVGEPLEALAISDPEGERVRSMLQRLELPSDSLYRYPRSLSGGQRQRVALARALIHSPELLVGDEPVSALDVLVRGRIIQLFQELKRELGLTLITVTHDLGIVPSLADHVLVMRQGKMVEHGTVEQVFRSPRAEYTAELIDAIPHMPSNRQS